MGNKNPPLLFTAMTQNDYIAVFEYSFDIFNNQLSLMFSGQNNTDEVLAFLKSLKTGDAISIDGIEGMKINGVLSAEVAGEINQEENKQHRWGHLLISLLPMDYIGTDNRLPQHDLSEKKPSPHYEVFRRSISGRPEFEAAIIENIEPSITRLVCECATIADAEFICEAMLENDH